MLRSKSHYMSRVAKRIQAELERINQKLPSGEISKTDEELVERLRKFRDVFGDLPVWPFDSSILRKFFTAYLTPVIGAALPIVVKAILGAIGVK